MTKDKCTQEQFESLHEAADSRKAEVKVDRQALVNLLIDHAALQCLKKVES